MKNRISEIQITPIKPIDGLVGFASLVFDDSFYLGAIGIFTRPHGGFRLTYPTRKSLNKKLHVFHPINKEVANDIEKAITTKFEEVTNSYT
jgi:DNA-binding cell septation regulator SpoVG